VLKPCGSLKAQRLKGEAAYSTFPNATPAHSNLASIVREVVEPGRKTSSILTLSLPRKRSLKFSS
jgi:hypothetical protein